MGPRSTLPLLPHPQFGPVFPSRPYFPDFFDLPAGRRGVGALVSGIGNLVLSNIWRNKYYLADLSLQVYPYLPREYIFKKFKEIGQILAEL
jgi:hypothetical protein